MIALSHVDTDRHMGFLGRRSRTSWIFHEITIAVLLLASLGPKVLGNRQAGVNLQLDDLETHSVKVGFRKANFRVIGAP